VRTARCAHSPGARRYGLSVAFVTRRLTPLLSSCIAGWINESMKVQETDPNYYGTVNYHHHLVHTIHHDLFDIPYDANRTMAPSWYVYRCFERYVDVQGPFCRVAPIRLHSTSTPPYLTSTQVQLARFVLLCPRTCYGFS
jgi:hypothetical protein